MVYPLPCFLEHQIPIFPIPMARHKRRAQKQMMPIHHPPVRAKHNIFFPCFVRQTTPQNDCRSAFAACIWVTGSFGSLCCSAFSVPACMQRICTYGIQKSIGTCARRFTSSRIVAGVVTVTCCCDSAIDGRISEHTLAPPNVHLSLVESRWSWIPIIRWICCCCCPTRPLLSYGNRSSNRSRKTASLFKYVKYVAGKKVVSGARRTRHGAMMKMIGARLVGRR